MSAIEDKKAKAFVKVIQNIIKYNEELAEYDTFASNCIASVIQLMLSKDPDYVNSLNNPKPVENNVIDEETKKDIDSIIARVKNKIKSNE